jgi:hypothetical protein
MSLSGELGLWSSFEDVRIQAGSSTGKCRPGLAYRSRFEVKTLAELANNLYIKRLRLG